MPRPALDRHLAQAAGRMVDAYAAVDWAATPLGPVADWSALRGAVELMLPTRFPVTLLWGPEHVLVYNEAYAALIGDKHPAALGGRAQVVFPEAWPHIGPMLEAVLTRGTASWIEEDFVPLIRNGRLEECYFTFSYSPVFGADGAVEGVMDIAVETTRVVIARRRLAVLRGVVDALSDAGTPAEIVAHAATLPAADPQDLPALELRLGGAAAGARDPRLPAAPATPPPASGPHVEATPDGRVAWLPLPDRPSALLVVRLSEQLPADERYLEFLGLLAAAMAQALGRLEVGAAERRMSRTLQESLLTQPPQADDLHVAVRYRPASDDAQIGGDWYDAFRLPDGTLALVIGDVAGHDRHAAAAMAQVRNLLRGVAYTVDGSPAHVLAALDTAMRGVAADVFATAVLATVEPAGDDAAAAAAARTLRWANAGHPPPVLIAPDGSTRLLAGRADPLLGVGDVRRADREVALEPGSAVVFYTDGLVERRGVPLPESLRWLAERLEGQQALSAEELCDLLIDQVPSDAEDDVALLVVRVDDGPPPGGA